LIGFDDSTKSEKKIMKKYEEEYLKKFKWSDLFEDK